MVLVKRSLHKMKSNTLKLWTSALLVFFFAACEDSTNVSVNVEGTDAVASDSADPDSVVIRDSVNLIDSVRYIDSLRIKDSVRIKDSLNIIDSVRYNEVTRYLDSLRIRDSVRIIDSLHIVDSVQYREVTRYLDSLRIKDSLRIVDSLNIIDSVRYKDVVRYIDSLRVTTRLNVIDSIYIVDSLNIIDSLRITDSINVIDSIHVVDSVVVHGPEDYLGACNDSTKGELKVASINGEDRYFYCDNGTLLWRLATEQEKMGVINSQFVTQSAVSDFTPVDSVFARLAEGEKLVVMLRHAERENTITKETPLTDNGRLQSQQLGAKLVGGPEIYYAGSEYLRTHQTYNNIAIGRGDADTLGDTIKVLNEGWFVKNQMSYYMALYNENDDGRGVTTRWAFEGGYDGAFYDLKTRSSELLEDHIIPALENSGKTIGVFITHDIMLIPLVSYVSEGRIDLRYYESPEDHWLNYLAGIAVVLKPDGTKVFYAVKGLDEGKMTIIE